MAGFGEQKGRKKKRPQHKPQTNGDSLLKKAINHHIQGDLNNAEKAYREAIDSGVLNVALFSNLGIICQTSQRTEEAISLYKKAIQINPNNPSTYTNLGGLYKDLGNLDQALATSLKSLELKPDNPNALMNLGGIYKELGNLNQALTSTLKSLELKPNNSEAIMNLGSIYKDLGNLDQALASTLKSLALKPDSPNALTNLGGIYKDLGKLDQALASTLKSLELKPDNPVAHMNLGIYYEILDELENALECYTKSANLFAQYKDENCLTSLISASIILLQMNKIDNAKTMLASALEIAENTDAFLKSISKKNKQHNSGYLVFLSKLIPEKKISEEIAQDAAFELLKINDFSFAFVRFFDFRRFQHKYGF